ncbi:MAG TPA: type II toxin-antitoxin system VapC family toxin [Microbacterium sp.]|nr:type II toxin-antitoxin system VapC family toxin [Microbacterium sp.]
MIYLDTSAIVKLFNDEAESGAIRQFLSTQEDALASSIVTEIEVRRVATRHGHSQEVASSVLASLSLLEVNRELCTQAGLLPGPAMRSLDALHVATAVRVRAAAFVTYDDRQAEAARVNGLDVKSPS